MPGGSLGVVITRLTRLTEEGDRTVALNNINDLKGVPRCVVPSNPEVWGLACQSPPRRRVGHLGNVKPAACGLLSVSRKLPLAASLLESYTARLDI